jgi:hypothetical protein
VEQFFGIGGDNGSVGDLLSGMEENDEDGAVVSDADISAAAENELVKLVNKIIVDAYRQGASDRVAKHRNLHEGPRRCTTGSA